MQASVQHLKQLKSEASLPIRHTAQLPIHMMAALLQHTMRSSPCIHHERSRPTSASRRPEPSGIFSQHCGILAPKRPAQFPPDEIEPAAELPQGLPPLTQSEGRRNTELPLQTRTEPGVGSGQAGLWRARSRRGPWTLFDVYEAQGNRTARRGTVAHAGGAAGLLEPGPSEVHGGATDMAG
jgi:hypothetical protein